jgi:hypothetical protein
MAGTRTGNGTSTVTSPVDGYAPEAERPPLASYGILIAVFNVLFAGALLLARRSGRQLPERVSAGDVLLLGTATHKASRLITKERITSALRAPFTEYKGEGGPAEVEESPRGTGVRRTVGELLVCPYCLGFWIAGMFSIGVVVAPRLTRFVAGALSAVTVSDFLQVAYKTAEERGLKGS